MTLHSKSVSELLAAAEDMLSLVEVSCESLGHEQLERKIAGLRNILVFGRTCQLAVASLKRKNPGFDDWYEQNWQGLRSDPLVQPLEKIREEMFKETGAGGVVTDLMVRSAGRSFGAPPRNARAFFANDRLGGTGWEVVMPNGSVEKYYVTVSDRLRPSRHSFEGENVSEEETIDAFCAKYLWHLREMVRSAREFFA